MDELPEFLPLVRYGLFTEMPAGCEHSADSDPAADPSNLSLSALLSQVLLLFTLEFESESPLALPACANFLRLLDESAPVAIRDLPYASGTSREAVNMGVGLLKRQGYAVVEPTATTTGKAARLTPKGTEARRAYLQLLAAVERNWRLAYGTSTMSGLRAVLGRIAARPDGGGLPPLLARAIEPAATCWRARIRPPATLPHHPLILHRGGYPDGS